LKVKLGANKIDAVLINKNTASSVTNVEWNCLSLKQSLRRSAISFAWCCLFLTSGCAVTPETLCPNGQKPAINDLLYLGTATPKGIVNPEDWLQFLKISVTPRFPNGFSFWPAQGQWQSNTGIIVYEASYILNLIHPNDGKNETAVNAIINDYRQHFEQEAVLRVQSPVCTSLNKL